MVAEDNLGYLGRHPVSDKLVSHARVMAELDPLLVRQRARLVEDASGDEELPDVVEFGRHLNAFNVLWRQRHFHGEVTADPGRPAPVACELRINALEQSEKSVQRFLSNLELESISVLSVDWLPEK